MASRAQVKLEELSKFQDTKYTSTDDAFGAVLRKTLLLDNPNQHGPLSQSLEKPELVAEINKPMKGEKKQHATLSLIWRRKVNEINVRY